LEVFLYLQEMPRVSITDSYNIELDSPPIFPQLKDELAQLRESTKEALVQAWGEVESLQQQNAVCSEALFQKDKDFHEMRQEKKMWHSRCLKTEAKLKQMLEKRDSPCYHGKKSLSESLQLFTEVHNSNESKDLNESNEEFSIDIHNALDNVLRLTSRNKAIASLEQTLNEKLTSMQRMEVEMRSLLERQKIEKEKLYVSHAQKDKQSNDLVESLRRQLAGTVPRN